MRWLSLAAGATSLVGFALGDTVAKALPFPKSCSGVAAIHFEYGIADGWAVTKVAGGLTQARAVVFDTNGNLILLQVSAGLTVHTFGDDGCINATTTLLANRALNHGLALSPDGKTLYASSVTTAWSWAYDAAAGKLSNQKVLVKGMSPGGHSTRTLAVVPQQPELLLAQVGSNANWDYPSESPSAGRAIVKIFDTSKVPDGGYNYNSQGQVFGYGMRNEIALAFDPAGHVWGAENSGDDFRRTIGGQATDIHQGNPAEKLNYLGDPLKPAGTWFGYPTCFAVWEPSLITDKVFKTGEQFVVTPNTTFADSNCAGKATPPRLSFMAHSAPISAAFDKEATNLYITFHGSWDRQPATGYKLVQVPFKKLDSGLYDPVAPADSQKGYNDILWAKDPGSCSSQTLQTSSCWRLAGVAWDPAGTRLFVTSDNAAEGELFVLSKTA